MITNQLIVWWICKGLLLLMTISWCDNCHEQKQEPTL